MLKPTSRLPVLPQDLPPKPLFKKEFQFKPDLTFLQKSIYPPDELHSDIFVEFMPDIIRYIENKMRDIQEQPQWMRVQTRKIDPIYELYRSFLNEIPHLEGYDIVRAYFLIKDILPIQLQQRINKRYADEGYTFWYFGWINRHHPYVKAMRNQVPLNPATFEATSTVPISLYEFISQEIESGRKNLEYWFSAKVPKIGHFGWSRKALRTAILEGILDVIHTSGLPIYVGAHGKEKILRSMIFPGAPGILSAILPGSPRSDRNVHTPIGINEVAFPRTYYETLYRKFFNTLSNLDWYQVCKHRGIDIGTLRFVAINDFNLDLMAIRRLKYQELCKAIGAEAQRRKQLRQQIEQEFFENLPVILYQPGSRWIQPLTRELFRPEEPKPEQIREEYQEIFDRCQNLKSTSKGELIFLVNRLGLRERLPPDLTNVSKEQLCRLLTNYVKLLYTSR